MASGRGWVRSRKAVQALALVAFLLLFVFSRTDGLPGDLANIPVRLDPLLALTAALAGRAVQVGAALALATVVLTLIFGRAWCGWLCPLGTVLDLFPLRKGRRRIAVPEGWRNVKYALLLVIVFAALLGNQTLVFLDPLAILLRTLAAAVWPVLDRLITALVSLMSQVPGLEGLASSADSTVRPLLLPAEPVAYQDAVLVAAFFVGLVALNALAPRFWCRYLCPLGGLLGLISRVALVQRRVVESCGGCRLCAPACPTGTIDPERGFASDPAECTVCMDCLATCGRGANKFAPARPALAEGRPYDPTRRQLLIAFGAAAAGIALFRSNLLARRESPFLLRPPGSREANADAVALTNCTRCSECVRVCPTGAIQPAVFQAGLEGIGTPVVVPRLGYCDYGCNACGQICPTMAIPLLSLEAKQRQVIGKAYIDQDRCLPWSDGVPCVVCEEMCPVPEKAIRLEEREVWMPDGTTAMMQVPHVVRELCIGCGICEFRCPVSGDAAIRVYVPPLAVPF
jgi:polyferredoxin